MTRTRSYVAEVAEVKKQLRAYDSPNGAIPVATHVRAIEADARALAVCLRDGTNQPLERWRLARVAAHAIALMAEGSE